MLMIAGTIDVHPDDLAAYYASVKLVTDASRTEPGCIVYRFSRDLDDPNRVCLFEIWADKAALDAHLQMPHLHAHRERLSKLRQTRSLMRYEAEEIGAL